MLDVESLERCRSAKYRWFPSAAKGPGAACELLGREWKPVEVCSFMLIRGAEVLNPCGMC